MRWLMTILAVALLLLSLLTVVKAWNVTLWKAAIVAGEFGHVGAAGAVMLFCALLAHAAVMGAPAGGPRRVLGFGLVATGAAAALFSLPVVSASLVARGLSAKLGHGLALTPPPEPWGLDYGALWRVGRVVPRAEVSIHRYTPTGAAIPLELDFYAPVGNPAGRPAPCVVVVHGGGWDSGDRAQLAAFNHWLAHRGWAVAAVSYRLAPAHPWPAQREDMLTAVAWLKSRAAALGIDGSRLVLLGRSAGAQIATAVAYGADDPAIRGVIALYGVFDMEFVWSISREDDVLNSVKLMRQYLGGGPTVDNQAAYDSASAQGLVRTGRTPPTLLMHGAIDTLCWVEHSRRLATRLAEAGVPHAYIELPWAVHAFDLHLRTPGGQLTAHAVSTFLSGLSAKP